jgi:hypothetical protein
MNPSMIEMRMVGEQTKILAYTIKPGKRSRLGLSRNSLFVNIATSSIVNRYLTMESIPATLFEDNLENLVNLGYIMVQVDETGRETMALSTEGTQWVEDNGELIKMYSDCISFDDIILTQIHACMITVMTQSTMPVPSNRKKRSSGRIKTERTLYCPGVGADGKWVDIPSSPKEVDHVTLDLQLSVQKMELNSVETEEALANKELDVVKAKSTQGDIMIKGGNQEIANDHGIYVHDLE